MQKYFENINNDDISGRKALNSSNSLDDSNSFSKRDVESSERKLIQRYEIQCELNSQGASDLVIDLFMSDISPKVFKETVLLAIALLEGGNTHVQV